MLKVTDGDPPSTEFPTLAPEFASVYGRKHARWVNTVTLRALGREDIATVLPLNVTNPAWALMDSHFEHIVIGTEGWTFPQRHKGLDRDDPPADTRCRHRRMAEATGSGK